MASPPVNWSRNFGGAGSSTKSSGLKSASRPGVPESLGQSWERKRGTSDRGTRWGDCSTPRRAGDKPRGWSVLAVSSQVSSGLLTSAAPLTGVFRLRLISPEASRCARKGKGAGSRETVNSVLRPRVSWA